ncbi:MAG: hypothetical protein H2057_03315 [Alphaproteobacteria bacterium]|nr:hypothetical protein [Alphaproteobacteria bacterium]
MLHVKSTVLDQCGTLIGVLKKLEMVDPQGEETRTNLLKQITALQQKVASLSSEPNELNVVLGDTLIGLQQNAGCIERKVNLLVKRQEKAERTRQKAQAIAYLETLSQLPKEIIPSPTSGNLRAQYGHEKEEGAPVAKAPDSLLASTPVIQEAPQENWVVFSLLNSAQKQYDAMQKVASMRGKYKTFMHEIAANPLQIEGTTGRTKLLQGDTGLFARRFDKGNRMAYKVSEKKEGAYEVMILSLLGHYKDLDRQLQHLDQ